MNLRLVNSSILAKLKSEIPANLDYYKGDAEFVSSMFEQEKWSIPTRIYTLQEMKLQEPSGSQKYDLANTKIVYEALKHMTPLQASDERLWVYLSHVTFWKYMRSRWGLTDNNDNPAGYVGEHYFVAGSRGRALLRNGISRLWWYGYLTYDNSRDNKYELTELLLSKLDITQQLLERSFSRSRKVSTAVLSSILELDDTNREKAVKRQTFRNLMIYINYRGGVSVLDAMSEEDIRSMIIEAYDRLLA
jgi:hypothetical protein